MFVYEKKLQYPVKIANCNPKIASLIITQYGGPDGELGASLRYLSQRYSMPYPELKGLLTDIGTDVAEMLHYGQAERKDAGLLYTIENTDRIIRYSEFNHFAMTDHPKVKKKATVRTINLFAGIPDLGV